MADKLSESSWTSFTRKLKLDLDDRALAKALASLDKTSDDKPEPRAAALSEAVEQIKKQVALLAKRKKELGDKVFDEVKAKLYALLDAAETQLAETNRALQAASDDADEEASPALLTTAMVPLIRQLKKGEVRYPAMIAGTGKSAAVLISRRPISNSRRKLLSEALGATGGIKFYNGECHYADKTLYFALDGPVGGLARRVRAALLEQTDLRLKVKLVGVDGMDEEGEEEAAGADATAAEAPAAPTPEQLAYFQRLRQVRDPLTQALKGSHPEASRLRALMAFATEKAELGAYAAAGQALDVLARLLSAGTPASEAPPSAGAGLDEALSNWTRQRSAAVVSLKEIAERIAAARHPRSAGALIEIKAVLANLTPQPRTLQQVAELENYLGEDRVVRDVCALAQDVRTPLMQALGGIRAELAS